jgi:hypothetical protein
MNALASAQRWINPAEDSLASLLEKIHRPADDAAASSLT